MKITVFYPESRHSGWNMSQGIPAVLRRMGHTVVDGPIPVERDKVSEQQFGSIKETVPSLEALKEQDLVLVSGPEHVAPWLDTLYGKYEWKNLGVPRAAWYHESFFRDDYTIDFDVMSMWADEHFFPAVQDADFFDQESFAKGRSHWLPYGVDTKVFCQKTCARCSDSIYGTGRVSPVTGLSGYSVSEMMHGRQCGDCLGTGVAMVETSWPIAFIGMMYERRQKFLNALARHHFPKIRIGSVNIEDLSGWCARESVERLASNYRRIGVFFNLPSMSQLLVTKLYEVMACGTFLLTPMLPPDRGANRNIEPFISGKHLVAYRPSNLPYVAQLLRDWSSEETRATREAIAAAGCAEVHKNHRLEQRLQAIMETCVVKEAVQ